MKPKFRLEDYTGDYVMHCPEKWMAEKFCKLLHNSGRTWVGNHSYVNKPEDPLSGNSWEEERDGTCYNFNEGMYGSKRFYLSEPGYKIRYKILEFDNFDWSDEKENTMTKSDLKVGYVVKFRNEMLGMVMPDESYGLITVNNNGTWTNLFTMDEDMTFAGLPNLEIVEVYGLNCLHPTKSLQISTEGRDLLWKRKEAKKMTVSEISEIVSKSLGYDVEVEVVKEH